MKLTRYALGLVVIVFCAAAPHSWAVSISDYMIVTSLSSGDGDAFIMSNSVIGGRKPPGATTSDGDAAITNNGKVNFSNSTVYSTSAGPGAQGVDCSNSYNDCTLDGGNISSGNSYDDTFTTSTMANNTGIQGTVDLSGVTSQLATLETTLYGASATGSRSISGGTINSNTIWDYSGGSGELHIIDLDTEGSDFSISSANLTITGDAGDTIIFRLGAGHVMDVSSGDVLLGGGLTANNLMFLADADEGEVSFTLDNVEFYGALWDIDSDDVKNIAHFNNVDFCGQVVTDGVNLQDSYGSACTFNTSAVPLPASLPLFGMALAGLGWLSRRKVNA